MQGHVAPVAHSAVTVEAVDLTIPALQRPVIALIKNADRSFVDQPGTEISYTLLLAGWAARLANPA